MSTIHAHRPNAAPTRALPTARTPTPTAPALTPRLVMYHPRRLFLALPLLCLVTTPAWADPAADALVARFVACLEAEGGSLSAEDQAALAAVAPQMLAAFGDSACSAGDGSGCAAALDAASCSILAGVWHAPLEAALPDPPPWILSFSASLGGRVRTCVGSSPDLLARVQTWETSLASGLTSVIDLMGCTPDETEWPGCEAAMQAMDCDGVANGVTSGQAIPLDGSAMTACAPLFGCGTDWEETMAEIEAESQ